ncbi:hypothetical protein ACFLXH_01065 [Chloroflexota bacterium]
MMQHRPLDPKLLEVFKGSSTSRGLEEQKGQLALIQSACVMALEGTTRATASEITAKAMTEFGIEATPSFAGQVFANLQIATVTSHGKSRFVLEQKELEEIRKGMVAKCEEQVTRLKESLKIFHDLPQQIEDLQGQWQEIIDLRKREREFIIAINEERSKPNRLPELKAEADTLRQRATFAIELEKECQQLSRKIKRMPSLEEKSKSLKVIVAAHEAKLKEKEQEAGIKEREIAAKEKELADRIARLQKRSAWATLADLQHNIDLAQVKLNNIEKDISRNQSFLERLLKRKENKD